MSQYFQTFLSTLIEVVLAAIQQSNRRLVFLRVAPSPAKPREPETESELAAWWQDAEYCDAKEVS